MNFNKILKSLFGDKSSRDMKLIQPAVYPEVQKLDNDALRARTKTLQQQVQNSANEQKKRIEELKATIENTPIDERADIFAQIDKIEKEVLEIYEGALNEVIGAAHHAHYRFLSLTGVGNAGWCNRSARDVRILRQPKVFRTFRIDENVARWHSELPGAVLLQQ